MMSALFLSFHTQASEYSPSHYYKWVCTGEYSNELYFTSSDIEIKDVKSKGYLVGVFRYTDCESKAIWLNKRVNMALEAGREIPQDNFLVCLNGQNYYLINHRTPETEFKQHQLTAKYATPETQCLDLPLDYLGGSYFSAAAELLGDHEPLQSYRLKFLKRYFLSQ